MATSSVKDTMMYHNHSHNHSMNIIEAVLAGALVISMFLGLVMVQGFLAASGKGFGEFTEL